MMPNRIEKYFSSIFILLLSSFFVMDMQGQVLTAPGFDCVSTDKNGNVILEWTPPSDPSNVFYSYSLYVEDNLGNTSRITTLGDINISSYYYTGANANMFPKCYYMIVTSNTGSLVDSPPSAQSCNIHLSIAPATTGSYFLSWTEPFDASVNPNAKFEIWMEYPAGTWRKIDEVDFKINRYLYVVDICETQLQFQIRLANSGSCSFDSNLVGDGILFTDETVPPTTFIERVTVNPTNNHSVISWNKNPARDTYGYIVYQCLLNTNTGNTYYLPRDTICGADVTSWEFDLSKAGIYPERFAVAAFDSCYSSTLPPCQEFANEMQIGTTEDECHRSIWVTAASNPCKYSATITWTRYEGWFEGVENYEIFAKGPDSDFESIGLVDGEQFDLLHENLIQGAQYEYYVVAYATNSTLNTHSNVWVFKNTGIIPPETVYLLSASVLEKGSNIITTYTSRDIPSFSYELQRENLFTEEFDPVERIPSTGNAIVFTESDLKNDIYSYQYRVITHDECGVAIDTSNLGRNIVLSGRNNADNFVNAIYWTPYGDWENGVEYYDIYRSVGSAGSMDLLASVDADQSSYYDNIEDYLTEDGLFCYVIEAHEGPNSIGLSGVSRSNEICVSQKPLIWIPNAFTVGGYNPEFKPVISFADFDDYSMVIYSRWGDIIFTTSNVDEGWFGKKGDWEVPEGVYAYYIRLKDGKGQVIERRGTVTLLKRS